MAGDRITANLPSRDFEATERFYAALGFVRQWRDDGWMILARGPLELEFFPHPELDPYASWFSACIRVDDVDGILADFAKAGLPRDHTSIPRLVGARDLMPGLRMAALVDADGSLLRILGP